MDNLKVERDMALKSLTTLNLGGPVDYLVRVSTHEDVQSAVSFAKGNGFLFTVLGGGSNMLVADAGVGGIVIKNEIHGISFERQAEGIVYAFAGGGEDWDTLVKESVARGLWGIENLSHIPGTVGAAPVQNIGAYGQEVGDRIVRVEAFDSKTHKMVHLSRAECLFGYRSSVFKTHGKNRYVIIRICIELHEKGNPTATYPDVIRYRESKTSVPGVSDMREAIISIRSKKFPKKGSVGTAGSFFKNPVITRDMYDGLLNIYGGLPCFVNDDGSVKVPLAWLLEHIGEWKGVRRGNVGCFEKQPLVLVTYDGATAEECVNFAKEIAGDVFLKTNIKIEPEVTFIGLE